MMNLCEQVKGVARLYFCYSFFFCPVWLWYWPTSRPAFCTWPEFSPLFNPSLGFRTRSFCSHYPYIMQNEKEEEREMRSTTISKSRWIYFHVITKLGFFFLCVICFFLWCLYFRTYTKILNKSFWIINLLGRNDTNLCCKTKQGRLVRRSRRGSVEVLCTYICCSSSLQLPCQVGQWVASRATLKTGSFFFQMYKLWYGKSAK